MPQRCRWQERRDKEGDQACQGMREHVFDEIRIEMYLVSNLYVFYFFCIHADGTLSWSLTMCSSSPLIAYSVYIAPSDALFFFSSHIDNG